MANVYPIQERTIDPYASYNSDCTNRLTRMVTKGRNCIYGIDSLQVSIDPANLTDNLIVGSGECFKDDVIINVLDPFTIDMTDSDFYVQGAIGRDIIGIYYIVVDYAYVKSRPAPRASIKILKPDQHSVIDSYLFLKAVSVVFNPSSGMFEIGEIYDWDPNFPTNQRIYNNIYAGASNTLPQWHSEDKGKIIYTLDENELYFGNDSNWESFSGIRDNVNTLSMTIGQLGYMNSDGTIHPSISTAQNTSADCVVMSIGETDGKVRLYGRSYKTNIQSGITVHVGDKLFLSRTQAGTITNVVPITGYAQRVGVCLRDNLDGTAYIWFMPSEAYDTEIIALINELQDEFENLPKMVRKTINQIDWISDINGFYYVLIGHAFPTLYCSVTCIDITIGNPTFKIQPQDIGYQVANPITSTRTGDVVIWMPTNSLDLEVILIG